MTVLVEKRFAVEVVYNGVEKRFEVRPEEHVSVLLRNAIAAFGITQNSHMLALFRQNGTELNDNQTVEQAGLKPDEILLLRQSAVRGGAGLIEVPRPILEATFWSLRDCGLGKSECVAYWTGPASELTVDGTEHPVHSKSPFGYEIDGNWLTEFCWQLARSRRSVRAQVHTHPGRAFHSETDNEWPIVSQAGFLSVVIPRFASGNVDLTDAWIGRLEPDGTWQQLRSAAAAFVFA